MGALDDLDPADRTRLAELVERAAQARAAALGAAIEESLRYVPVLLRGTVKRTLGL